MIKVWVINHWFVILWRPLFWLYFLRTYFVFALSCCIWRCSCWDVCCCFCRCREATDPPLMLTSSMSTRSIDRKSGSRVYSLPSTTCLAAWSIADTTTGLNVKREICWRERIGNGCFWLMPCRSAFSTRSSSDALAPWANLRFDLAVI